MFNSFLKQSSILVSKRINNFTTLHKTTNFKSFSYEKQLLNANKNIHKYVLLGRLSDAVEEFKKMERNNIKPDLYTFTEILNGYVECGKVQESYRLFEEMKERGIQPNIFTYTTLIKGLCKVGEIEKVPEILEKMRSEGIEPNSVT
jgi:pentatricopeptide repeat protein